MVSWIVWNGTVCDIETVFTLNWIVWHRTDYLYKMDLSLNNLQRLIYHKIQPTKLKKEWKNSKQKTEKKKQSKAETKERNKRRKRKTSNQEIVPIRKKERKKERKAESKERKKERKEERKKNSCKETIHMRNEEQKHQKAIALCNVYKRNWEGFL